MSLIKPQFPLAQDIGSQQRTKLGHFLSTPRLQCLCSKPAFSVHTATIFRKQPSHNALVWHFWAIPCVSCNLTATVRMPSAAGYYFGTQWKALLKWGVCGHCLSSVLLLGIKECGWKNLLSMTGGKNWAQMRNLELISAIVESSPHRL